ncbi:DNA double-strand break repair Rad50 ATPase [Ceratobasidium sp. AG-Ba]|nr:DNA double-strand break repair Rad50 ATPase [Ceratobasidium sp. AG-Ba]
MHPIEPGTYRIGNECGGTAITVPDWNEWDVVCWHKHDGRNQQWFVQRSGEGFRIKNCANGHFLAVSRVSDGTPVYCGRYPTTWVLNLTNAGTYTIKCGDDDRLIDLDGWGKKHDGNHMHLQWNGGEKNYRRWWFERLSTDSGEAEPQLRRDIGMKDEELAGCRAQIAYQEHKIAELTQQLAAQSQELADVKNNLVQKSNALVDALEALRQANEDIESQKAKISQIENDNSNKQIKQELARQQEETDQLRNKMEAFEKLMSQMMIQDDKRPNNMV